MALGVHLGNRGRGNLGLDLLVGAGILAGGVSLAAATGGSEGGTATAVVLVLVPVAQLVAMVATEQASARSKGRNLSLSIGPRADGGISVQASLAF